MSIDRLAGLRKDRRAGYIDIAWKWRANRDIYWGKLTSDRGFEFDHSDPTGSYSQIIRTSSKGVIGGIAYVWLQEKKCFTITSYIANEILSQTA